MHLIFLLVDWYFTMMKRIKSTTCVSTKSILFCSYSYNISTKSMCLIPYCSDCRLCIINAFSSRTTISAVYQFWHIYYLHSLLRLIKVLVSLYPSTSKWVFQRQIYSECLSRGSFMQVILYSLYAGVSPCPLR